MNKSVIKLKSEELYIFDREDGYVLFTTPSLYDDDEVRYILQDIEDSMDKKGIEVIRTTISTSKKIELARFEDLEIRQVKIKLL
jgi:hypothetical protein